MSATRTIPISDTELLATAYVNIKSTGIYDNDMEKWDNRIINYNDWENFKHAFLSA